MWCICSAWPEAYRRRRGAKLPAMSGHTNWREIKHKAKQPKAATPPPKQAAKKITQKGDKPAP